MHFFILKIEKCMRHAPRLFKYYFNWPLRILQITKMSSYRNKIELFWNFRINYLFPIYFLDSFDLYSVILHAKIPFSKAKIFLGIFCTCTKVSWAKKHCFPALIECLKIMLKHEFQLSHITIEKHKNDLNPKANTKPKLSVLKSPETEKRIVE